MIGKSIRIYYPQPITEDVVLLDKKASHHLLTVLRCKVNDDLILFDGSGFEFQATIKKIEKKLAQVEILDKQKVDRESTLNIHLGQSLAKGERMDFVMQKAVELGVTEITPLITGRTNVKLDADRQAKRLAHFQQIVIHACEQCGRTIIPTVHPITPLSTFIEQNQAQGFILHPENGGKLSEATLSDNISLLVGPEGGFTNEEIEHAVVTNFTPITFGSRILRTETASIAVISALQVLAGAI